ncbi:MAG: indole-3-glycerol phosphate synthase TrpC [Flavobacteriaceae bacterium]
MTILDKIIAYKKQEVAKLRSEVALENLVKSPQFKRTPISLKKALTAPNSTGIIAEFKRQSPSKGVINSTAKIGQVTQDYMSAGVAAQSILTDAHFFGGSILDVIKARKVNKTVPILRKDFIIDAFQIIEAKAIGADIILLIVACLTKQQIKDFGTLATDLGLDVLYEVHSLKDLEKIELDGKIIGINNRNLKTFKVDLENSISLANQIPSTCIKVSESGISDPKTIVDLKAYGFKGFLIGENFMKTDNPGTACKEFINELRMSR